MNGWHHEYTGYRSSGKASIVSDMWQQDWIKHIQAKMEIITDYVVREYQITGRYPLALNIAGMFEVDLDMAKSCIKRAKERTQ